MRAFDGTLLVLTNASSEQGLKKGKIRFPGNNCGRVIASDMGSKVFKASRSSDTLLTGLILPLRRTANSDVYDMQCALHMINVLIRVHDSFRQWLLACSDHRRTVLIEVTCVWLSNLCQWSASFIQRTVALIYAVQQPAYFKKLAPMSTLPHNLKILTELFPSTVYFEG